jgi:hypothetical protein
MLQDETTLSSLSFSDLLIDEGDMLLAPDMPVTLDITPLTLDLAAMSQDSLYEALPTAYAMVAMQPSDSLEEQYLQSL